MISLAEDPGAAAPSGPQPVKGGASTARNLLLLERVAGASHALTALLREAGHFVAVATSKEDAFNRLFEAGEKIDAVLLDASLTEPNVVTFAHEFRRLLIAHYVPVIRLAAERIDERIAAALRAGVWHYLDAACAPELLLALVESVAKQRAEYLRLRTASEKSCHALDGLMAATFRFRILEDVERIAQLVAAVCPAPDRVVIGLTELMLNAIEHGNLRIGYEAKRRINAQGVWLDEIRRRLDAPEQADRFAVLSFERDLTGLRFRIEDCGDGFDWRPYLEIDSTQASDSRGRGIAVARMLSFDSVVYSGRGNIVTVVVAGHPSPD